MKKFLIVVVLLGTAFLVIWAAFNPGKFVTNEKCVVEMHVVLLPEKTLLGGVEVTSSPIYEFGVLNVGLRWSEENGWWEPLPGSEEMYDEFTGVSYTSPMDMGVWAEKFTTGLSNVATERLTGALGGESLLTVDQGSMGWKPLELRTRTCPNGVVSYTVPVKFSGDFFVSAVSKSPHLDLVVFETTAEGWLISFSLPEQEFQKNLESEGVPLPAGDKIPETAISDMEFLPRQMDRIWIEEAGLPLNAVGYFEIPDYSDINGVLDQVYAILSAYYPSLSVVFTTFERERILYKMGYIYNE